MKVVTLTGSDLATVLEWMAHLKDVVEPYELRVGIDVDGFKMSADRSTWSPGKGTVEKD